jgi:hypothetical protein
VTASLIVACPCALGLRLHDGHHGQDDRLRLLRMLALAAVEGGERTKPVQIRGQLLGGDVLLDLAVVTGAKP